MSAHQRTTTYFPELTGDEQREADAWFLSYLRLVVRIFRERSFARASSYPQVPVDETRGTGKVRTARNQRPPSQ